MIIYMHKEVISHLSLALMIIFHFRVWKINAASCRKFLRGQKELDMSVLYFPVVIICLLALSA
jgi:hypothetical protein